MQLETAEMNLIHGGPVLAESRRFLVKLAETSAELEQAFRLRYEVFKLEQGRMASLQSRIDRDEFDDYCSHLLVIDRETNPAEDTIQGLKDNPVLADVPAIQNDNFYVITHASFYCGSLRTVEDIEGLAALLHK